VKKPHTSSEQLRPLTPLTLARIAGGESASTSTSGTPAAGDDTIGDRHDPIFVPVLPEGAK
jgi:hypothetical protein